MGRHALITLATDGATDFVVMPNGSQRNLGKISPLALIQALASQNVRALTHQFLAQGEVMFGVDLDKLDLMCTLNRARHYASLLMDQADRTSVIETGKIMKNARSFQAHLNAMGETIASLGQRAASGAPTMDLQHRLQRIAKEMELTDYGDQSDNSSYYGLDKEVKVPVDPSLYPEEITDPEGDDKAQKSAAVLSENIRLAGESLRMNGESHQAIERLVAAGRKFKHVQALSDLRSVTTRVASALESSEIHSNTTELKLAFDQASKLHRIFVSPR